MMRERRLMNLREKVYLDWTVGLLGSGARTGVWVIGLYEEEYDYHGGLDSDEVGQKFLKVVDF